MINVYNGLNIALLMWGGLFCLVTAFCLFLSKNHNKGQRKWMLCMQLSAALLLANESLAWMFRGKSGQVAYYMVRISNFTVYVVTLLILFLFQQYIAHRLSDNEERLKDVKINISSVIAIFGIVMVIISQFTGLYYHFDSENFYHRNSGYIFSVIIPLAGMLLDLILLIQYRKRVSKIALFSMLSYILLPSLVACMQFLFFGFSLISFSIAFSMVLMYIVTIEEQDKKLSVTSKSKKEVEYKLQIASTLNKCVKELSQESNEDRAICNLLKIIAAYFDADRSYIFEINSEKNILVNTYEYVEGDDVVAQMDNLQEVPIDVISVWMESFKKFQPYYIFDVESEKKDKAYAMLKEQDIYCLLAVPIIKDNEIKGFLGLDNPKSNTTDTTLLMSIQFFIVSVLTRKKEKEHLIYLSYIDKLTNIYNRNKYIELLDSVDGQIIYRTGVACIDLNGLKAVNDKNGHIAGDAFIKTVATAISSVFPDMSYRIGGDEFAVCVIGIDENEFKEKISLLRTQMKNKNVSASVGSLWQEKIENLEEAMIKADSLMYKEKQEYHRSHNCQ